MSKKFNKSRTYLLPLLMNKYDIEMSFVENTYLYTVDDFESVRLHISCKFDNEEQMVSFESKAFRKNTYIRKSKGESDNNVIYTLPLAKEHHNTYHLFIDGKYSKIQNIDKNTIMMFWNRLYKGANKPFLSKVRQIFDRSDILKKELEEQLKVRLPEGAELSSVINIEDEIYYGN